MARSSIAGSTPWGPLFCAIPGGPTIDVFVAPGAANASNSNRGDDPAFPLASLSEFTRRASLLARMDASLRVHLESGVHPWAARGLQAIAMKAGVYLAILGDGADQPGDDGTTNIIAPTAAAAGSDSMEVVTAGLTIDALANHFIEILTGDAAGDRRLIQSNTTTQIVPAYRFSAAVAEDDEFRVFRPNAILELSGWPFADFTPPSLDVQSCIARDCGGPVSAGGQQFASAGVMLATVGVRGLPSEIAYFSAQRSSLVCYGTQVAQVDDSGIIEITGDPATRFSCGVDCSFGGSSFLAALAPVALDLAAGPESWLGYGLGLRNPGASGSFSISAGNMVGFVGASEYSVAFSDTRFNWFGGGFIATAGFSALDIGPNCYVDTGAGEDSTLTPRPLVHNKLNNAESYSLSVYGGGVLNAFRLLVQKTNQGIGVLVGAFEEGENGLPGQCALKGGQANPLFLGVSVIGITATTAPDYAIVAVAGGVVTTLGETGSGGPPETTGWPADGELAVMFVHKSALLAHTVEHLDFDDPLVNFDGATMPTPNAVGPDTELAGGRYGYIRLLG